MTHGVSRRIERDKLNAAPDFHDVPGFQPDIHAVNFRSSILMREDLSACRIDHCRVAAGMIAMLVRVENLGNLPSTITRPRKAFLVIQRVDGKRFSSVIAGQHIIEIAVSVPGPNLFYLHAAAPRFVFS